MRRFTTTGRWKWLRWTIVPVLLALLLWPAHAFSAGTVSAATFDLQAAINAAPVGGTVNIPAGTFTFTQSIVLRSGVTLKGMGVDQTVLTRDGASGPIPLLYGSGVSGVTISDLTLSSAAPTENVVAVWISNYSNVSIQRVKVTNSLYWLKADTRGSNLTIRDLVARNCGQGYISNLAGGAFANLDLEMVTQKLAPETYHAIYLEGNNHGLAFSNVRAAGGSGWTIQMYQETQPSDTISFDGLTVSGLYPVVVASGFSGVTIRNFTATASGDEAVVNIYNGASNVLVDTFTASGGIQLVESSSSSATMRNGTYAGTRLGTGVTFQNVSLGSTTSPTTVPPTTTTTAPVTTTTVPPATMTTTLPPTTTATTWVTTTVKPTTTTTQAPPTTTTARVTATTVPHTATTTTLPPTTTATTWVTTTTAAPTTTTTARPTTTTQAPTTTSTTLPQSPVSTDLGGLSITTPTDQGVVGGTVRVRTSVAWPEEVAKVRLYVDGRALTQDYRYPFSFTWSTELLTPGTTYTLTGIAFDRSGGPLAEGSQQLTLAAPRTAAAQDIPAPGPLALAFEDMAAGNMYGSAVAALAEAGVVAGYTDGKFGPADTTTRAQLAKMISLSLGLADENTTSTPFRDLDEADADLYPHKYVAALYSVGAITGTSPTTFSPYAPVTRAQLIAILVRALETLDPGGLAAPAAGWLSAVGDTGFADYTRAIAVAEANGLLAGVDGYGPGWNPWAPASRGEAAQILSNVSQLK